MGSPIAARFQPGRPLLSVEFFPPKDEEGGRVILETAQAIREHLVPDFVSITYGAGGGTRERTFRYARLLKDDYGFEVMPHLTCVGSSQAELQEILARYHAEGFRNIMTLRGDPPKGDSSFQPHPDGLRYASELVAFIRAQFPDFCLGVAGYPEVHPEAPDAATDLAHLRHKVAQGASFVTTQLFYDNAVFFDFVRAARQQGITAPIVPGLMPIRSATQARKFCKVVPPELDARLEAAGEDAEAVREVGIDWTVRQIRELLSFGVPGVHLYIMNRSGMALEVVERLQALGAMAPRTASRAS